LGHSLQTLRVSRIQVVEGYCDIPGTAQAGDKNGTPWICPDCGRVKRLHRNPTGGISWVNVG
jgi:hypothetical protein